MCLISIFNSFPTFFSYFWSLLSLFSLPCSLHEPHSTWVSVSSRLNPTAGTFSLMDSSGFQSFPISLQASLSEKHHLLLTQLLLPTLGDSYLFKEKSVLHLTSIDLNSWVIKKSQRESCKGNIQNLNVAIKGEWFLNIRTIVSETLPGALETFQPTVHGFFSGWQQGVCNYISTYSSA